MRARKVMYKKHKGQVAVLVAVALSVLLGSMAIVADYALAEITRNRIQYALDAAVLAGAQDIKKSAEIAYASAMSYLALNGVSPDEAIVEVDVAGGRVSATATRSMNTLFATLVGIDSVDLDAQSEAIVGVAGSVSGGLRPYAITDRYYAFGDLITLKQDSSYRGNFNAVALGGTGASVLSDNALYGYPGVLRVGDVIQTETGNMIGVVNRIKDAIEDDPSTILDYTVNSYRLWTIPVVNTLAVNGRDDVTITGFAQIFVEGVVNSGGKMEIIGRFIQFVGSGEIVTGTTDYGVYAVKLTK